MQKVALMLASLALAQALYAKESSPIKLTTKSYKEVLKVVKNGEKKIVYEDAKKVIPGDVVLYKNSITNNGNSRANDLVLNNSIPKHTEYIEGSAKCQKDCNILFSVDNGKSFKEPNKLYVVKNGKKRLATAKDYTNVRWVLTQALEANSKTYVSFKTRLK